MFLPALLVACRGSDQKEAFAPRLQVAEPRHDFGVVVQEQQFRHDFAVRNGGSRPLLLEGVAPGRDCSGNVPVGSVAPGDSARVEVMCRAVLHGPFRETLSLRSNDPLAPQLGLELRAEVTPLLAFEQDQIDFDLAFGETKRERVRLTGARAGAARITVAEPGSCGFTINVLPPEADKAAGLELLLEAKQPGVGVGQIVIKTGLERPAELGLRYTCKVRGTLQVSPTNPYFNLRQPAPNVRWIEVSSSEPGFRIKSVAVTEGPFAASFEPADAAGHFRVKVTVLERQVKEDARGVVGKLLIASNDSSEPTKEIPLFAMGKPARTSPN